MTRDVMAECSGGVPLRVMVVANPDAGQLLRAWRQRRKLSQLDLSLNAAISSRHLTLCRDRPRET